MKIHFGGRFTKLPRRKYVDGEVTFMDLIDIDQCKIDILYTVMYQSLGYEEKLFYHYKIPLKGLDIRLRLLVSDSDIAEMLQHAHKHKIIYVYVEHDKSVVDPALNVDEAGPSKNDEGENEVAADEGNYDEDENEDGGEGEDYEADYGSKSEEDEVEDEGQNEEEDKAEDGGEREEEEEGYDEDKHIDDIVDEEHIVDEVEVEMNGFKFEVEGKNAIIMQPKLNMTETDLEVLDFDSFESDVDDVKESEFLNRDVANSCDCQNDKTNDNDKCKEILDQGKKVERNTKEIAKGKKVNVHDKGKGKMVNEEEEDKSECPWVLYISKEDKGKWDYVQELKMCNPNITVKIDVYGEENLDSHTRMFRRIYICFGALKDGFRASGRDLLGLDGAFMRGQYSGQLLTAVGVDANNGIYTVAYGIVESESTYSWTWFLTCLGDDLDLFTNSNFTFITDRQKGLLPAIAKLFPTVEHKYCVRHIYENMNMTWKGNEYKEMLWNCATACTVVEFNRHMDTLKGFNKKAYEWLKKIAHEHWSRSHFSATYVLLNSKGESGEASIDIAGNEDSTELEINADDFKAARTHTHTHMRHNPNNKP
ncbi:5'-nucleotidase domain-containing protein 4 [Tanacetum coccineum]